MTPAPWGGRPAPSPRLPEPPPPRAPVSLRPVRAALFSSVTRAGAADWPPLRAGGSGRSRLAPLSAMAAALERALREAAAALGRGGAGAAAAPGAVRAALAAAGGPAALGERERALFGAFLRSLARAPRAARPEGVWQSCFLEGPPGLALGVLLEALASAGSVRLGGRAGAGATRRGGLES